MKYLPVIFLFLAVSAYGRASKDTTVKYYDLSQRQCKPKAATFVKKVWIEDGLWKAEQRLYPSNILQMTGSFTDEALTKANGPFISYYDNGNRQREITFLNGKEHGTSKGWSENGTLVNEFHYQHGEMVDTGYMYGSNGDAWKKQLVDKKKTGTVFIYGQAGKLIFQNQLVENKKNGLSVCYAENGDTLGTTAYVNDSIITSTCNHPKVDGENCITRQVPELEGGDKAWSKYIEKSLQYPDFAMENGIQGVVEVQFVIDSLGNSSNLQIISSPHSSLSQEVIRIFKNIPKSTPAVIHNVPVSMTGRQGVIFRLE